MTIHYIAARKIDVTAFSAGCCVHNPNGRLWRQGGVYSTNDLRERGWQFELLPVRWTPS